jgi:hypothetical protein
MDFTDFPAPYDLEVPRRIGQARGDLSDEGALVLERIIARIGVPEDVVAAMEPSPRHDINFLLSLNSLFQRGLPCCPAGESGMDGPTWSDRIHLPLGS